MGVDVARGVVGVAALVWIVAAGCSLGDVSLEGKACPCIDGWVCDEASKTCVRADALVDASVDAREFPDVPDAPDVRDVHDVKKDISSDVPDAILDGGPDCSVHADARLWCTDKPDDMHADPNFTSAVVNKLETTYSWFDCWAVGAMHAGGNTTWYHTFGDTTSASGYVPAVDLNTPDAFDANPTAFGLSKCGT